MRCALASGLLTRDQIEEARTVLREVSADGAQGVGASGSNRDLADKLVQMGRLNDFQAAQLLQGRTKFSLGPYAIIDSLGRGGMGQVFKAVHGVLDRVVAIKVLPRAKSTPEAIASFAREIRAQAQLDHPNLVRALDAGEDGNVYYLVTEYVPGSDLRKLIRRNGRLDMAAAAGVISQVAAGLDHAHGLGLIHRDVKPGNILVTPEFLAKLSDLGLAGPLDGDAQSDPRFGKIVGTADYISPDHIKSPRDPTAAWDIYSLGCTLYYAVTGKVPFPLPRGTTADKARAHCTLRPLDPQRLNGDLDGEFVEVLAEMMAKDPSERTPTAADVIQRLRPWAERPPVQRKPTAPGSNQDNGDVDGDDLDDTQSSFPEIDEPLFDPPDEASQATEPVASADQETFSTLSVGVGNAAEPVAILGPLAFLVLLPVAVVALITLLWWVLLST